MTQRLSRAEYKETVLAAPKGKYRNIKVVVDDITFHSKREASRYMELKMLEMAGEISHLELQPVLKLYSGTSPVMIKSDRYPNGRHAKYIADFAYFDPKRNKRIIEDAKGMRTKEFILKKAFAEACYAGIEIVEI